MRVLYAALKYDYGLRAAGPSFEHNAFFDSLRQMGHDIVYFDIGTLSQALGPAAASERLIDVAKREHPDVLFAVLFREEIERDAMRHIERDLGIPTINWYTDDHWRFETFSTRWTPYFTWVVTTSAGALPKYRAQGFANVIKSQWACNHFQYRPLGLPKTYDVSFVGLPHGDRRAVIRSLRKRGLDVRVWGKGWASGRIAQLEMLSVFDQSRINLNLSNASLPSSQAARLLAAVVRLLEAGPLPGGLRDEIAGSLVSLVAGNSRSTAPPAQIKGRNFEVPGCGGLLLTDAAEDLEHYYVPGKEVAIFSDLNSLQTQIGHFLSHPTEREQVAAAGYARTLREHTYVHRFADIFKRAGLHHPSADEILNRPAVPGNLLEIAP